MTEKGKKRQTENTSESFSMKEEGGRTLRTGWMSMLQGHQGMCVDSCQQRGVPDSPGGRGTDTTLGYLVAQGHRDTAEGMTHALMSDGIWAAQRNRRMKNTQRRAAFPTHLHRLSRHWKKGNRKELGKMVGGGGSW